MKLIITGDKDGFDSVLLVDEFQTFFQSERKTDGTVTVTIDRFFGKNRDSVEICLAGISGCGIQNVMIDLPVFLEIPFIDSGRHHRLIGNFQSCDCRVFFGKRLLDADTKWRTVYFGTDGDYISTQTDPGVFDALVF